MDSWELAETVKYGWVVRSKFAMHCPFCGADMLLHAFYPRYNTIRDFYHVDIHMKCPRCGYLAIFGVAITKEEYKLLSSSKLKNRTITVEVSDINNISKEDEDKIKSRLEQMGYWGG